MFVASIKRFSFLHKYNEEMTAKQMLEEMMLFHSSYQLCVLLSLHQSCCFHDLVFLWPSVFVTTVFLPNLCELQRRDIGFMSLCPSTRYWTVWHWSEKFSREMVTWLIKYSGLKQQRHVFNGNTFLQNVCMLNKAHWAKNSKFNHQYCGQFHEHLSPLARPCAETGYFKTTANICLVTGFWCEALM